MALTVWETFLSLFREAEETDGESDEEEEKNTEQFVPSPLDLSVRSGHGGSDTQKVRELSRISEQAEELEEQRRDT